MAICYAYQKMRLFLYFGLTVHYMKKDIFQKSPPVQYERKNYLAIVFSIITMIQINLKTLS